MGKSAAQWPGRMTTLLLAFITLLFSVQAQARPLPIDHLCTSAPLFSAPPCQCLGMAAIE
jgi:hypothetical protein